MQKFFLDMFSSSEGVSHKRVLGALGFISLVIAMFTTHSERVVEAVEFCTIAHGLGSVAEKFSKKYGNQEGQQAE